MPDVAIRMAGASKRYDDTWAVRELNLEVLAGQTLALIGPSGCGKTTCLRLINRLVDPTSGRIEVLGQDITRADPPTLRRKIGYVIQEVGLFPHYTVARNVSVVPELLGWTKERTRERVSELLELVGLPEQTFAKRYPQQLSGGQRQRVGIARALAADPPVVLMDEPFGALDPITRGGIQEEFSGLSRRLQKTFVIVTHDIFEAVRLADEIAVIKAGSLEQLATPFELCHQPSSEFVASLLGSHRYQLKLMTVTLRDAIASLTPEQVSSKPSEGAALKLDPSCSVWHALEQLAVTPHEVVTVAVEGRPTYLSQKQLFLAVD